MDVSESLAVHQGRLIRLTDKVLLKRTQMQYQQANVETCRHFYNTSLAKLNPGSGSKPSEDPQGQVGQRKRRRRKRRSKLNENGGIDALQLDAATTPTLPDTEQEQVITAPDQVAPEHDFVEYTVLDSPVDFASLAEQYSIDYHTLTQEEAKLKALINELSSLEYELKELHESMRAKLGSKHFVRDLHTELEELNLEPRYSSKATSRAGTKTPSLIEEYFDEKGNAGVFRERLQEQEYWFHEGLLERALIADRGDPLDVSDEKYVETYNARRKDLKDDVEAAEAKAMALAERCREAGLDIDKYRKNNPSIQGASTAGRTNSAFGIYIPGDEEPGMAMGPLYEEKSHSPVRNRSAKQINTWLRSVPNHVDHDPTISAEQGPDISSDQMMMETDQAVNTEEVPKEVDQTIRIAEPTVKSEQTFGGEEWVSLEASDSQQEERILGQSQFGDVMRVDQENLH